MLSMISLINVIILASTDSGHRSDVLLWRDAQKGAREREALPSDQF